MLNHIATNFSHFALFYYGNGSLRESALRFAPEANIKVSHMPPIFLSLNICLTIVQAMETFCVGKYDVPGTYWSKLGKQR
jgi:hypothetical protein